MGYSLLSQFQGSLLGVSLGLLSKPLTDCSATAEKLFHPGSPLTPLQGNQSSSAVIFNSNLGLMLSLLNSMIARQGIVWQEWQQIWQTHQNLMLSQSQASDSSLHPEWEAAITTLPMMLFFHENRCRLKQHLQTAAQLWQPEAEPEPLETTVERLALAEMVAYLLRPSPDLQQLIPYILTQISQETQLARQLTQSNILLQQGASLETVLAKLTSNLAIAIYCFLSTPTAFSVSVRRAMRTHPDSSLTAGMTGALSGSYNGLPSIPISWQLKLRRLASSTAENSIPLDQQILNQSTQLFQVWAGLYSPTHDPNTNPLTSLIVAAPLSLPD